MKDRLYRLVLLTLLLSGTVAFAQQTPPVSTGKSSEPTTRQSNRRMAGNPSGTNRPQRQIQLQTPQSRLGKYQSGQPIQHQIQVPKRSQATMPVLLFFSAVVGALLFMSLFTITQFLLNRDAPYGWYAAYLASTSIWFWQAVRSWANVVPRTSDSTVFLSLMLLLGYGMMVSYLLFLSYLLEVPRQQPRLERWLRLFFWYIALSMIPSLAGLLIWDSTKLYELTGFFRYVGLVVLLVAMLRSKHPLKRYVLTGTTLLLSGILGGLICYVVGFKTSEPLVCIAVGTLLEVLCFSLALGRRFHLNKEEKVQAQQQLILQLEENGRLQQTYTLELERQLAQREADVLTKAHELEEQRVSQLQSDFVRRIAEAEMAGLRSQMNPHFIFNCLNSIKLYATENDSEKASEYLTKFSRLIRMVLENSRSERVTLQNELETLRLYMDMEAMRFKQKLSFRIDVAPDVDAKFLEIPPLLIQPYVENAIWHGLMHKPEGGSVHLRVTHPQENLLQLTITDDGVGRARSAELKSKSANHRKSFGLKMTSERISLVNQLYHTHTQVTIEDLVDAEGQPAGTEVVIQIPL